MNLPRRQHLQTFLVASLFSLATAACASTIAVASTANEPAYSFETYPLSTWNFGVVKMNSTYKIYRSEILGTAGLAEIANHLKQNNLPFPKTIIYMNTNGYTDDDQRALDEFKRQKEYGYSFFHSFMYSYRTYLDGLNPYRPKEDVDSGKYLGQEALTTFGTLNDPAVDGGVDALQRILNLVLDPARQPVLFHCMGGRHRTGMIALSLRYIEGGKWLEGQHEVRTFPLMTKRSLSNAQYEYYMHNTSMFRAENLAFVDRFFTQDPIGQSYISRYRTAVANP